MMAFCPNLLEIDGLFAQFALSLMPLDWLVNPGAVPSVSASQVGDIKIAVPPLDEQRQIAKFIKIRSSEIGAIRANVQAHISLLREYRSSLISAAVTGQLNIDEFEARQLEEA